MAAYLIDNPPAVRQWYDKRRSPLTGCTMLHTSESVMDSVGPDTGAENVARYIRGRTTPGSYHDLVDSDSWVHLIPYVHGAFHDGTGSNNWALALSFALRTSDWAGMTVEQRDGFLRQGARAFAAQQRWRRSVGAPLTELRYITKTESDAGMSGFCCHGWRDPGRRSDPGTRSPDLFPFDEWLEHCRAALDESEEDFMATMSEGEKQELLDFVRKAPLYLWNDLNDTEAVQSGTGGAQTARAVLGDIFHNARAAATFSALAADRQVDVDEEELAAALAPLIADRVKALTDEDLQRVAQAVADEQDRRSRDGDAGTGPVT